MGSLAGMILDDPESFHILTADMKEKIIEAARNKVNIQAAMTRKQAIVNIKRNFTLRNTWTAKQIQFTQMPKGRYSLSAIQSTVGATERAAYMERQEFGGIHKPLRGRTLAIPTLHARGGNMGVLVQKKYYLSSLDNLKVKGKFKAKKGTHKSRQVARAAVAFRERKLIHYGENLFFVDNFVARGGQVSFRTRQLYNFDKDFTLTQPSPWLLPAVKKLAAEGPRIFASQMKKVGF